MKVLLSIKPEFAEKIFSGSKTYEYRKRVFAKPDIRTVLVYATKPVALIIGEFDIVQVITGSPRDVWRQTKRGAGISYSFYQNYYSGAKTAVAYQVGQTRRFALPVKPQEIIDNFTAPQSYRYILEDLLTSS